MSAFLPLLSGGFVNADHVVKVYRGSTDREGNRFWEARLVDGETVRTNFLESGERLERALGKTIPAAPGTTLCAISVEPEGGARPTESDVYVFRYGVIAWCIWPGDDQPEPLTAIGFPFGSNDLSFVEHPDGRIDSIHDRAYDSLDQAKVHILADAQREWDKKHAVAA